MLPDASDFGVYSMYTTIIGFGTPFAILGLYDAMFREYFEKDDQKYRYDVTTTTQRMILFSSIIIALILVLFSSKLSVLFFGTTEYYSILILAGIGVFIGANKSPIQAPTRMQNQRKVYIFSGLLSSISMYAIAITLIYLGFAYFGLIYASIFSALLLLIFFWIRNYKFFLKGSFNKTLAKKLLKIGLPLLPTFLIYWIYKSMDKIMITNILDTTQLGIYSIGSKISQISTLIYAAFAGGYQFFAFSTMKDKDQVSLNSKVFDYLGALSIISLIVIYPFLELGFNVVFEGDYILGYIVVPYLYVSPLLLMLFQVVANQFLVIKKSYYATISLSIGAIVNVILNIVLINRIGIEGAAIATFIGYMITIITVMIISLRLKCMQYSKRIIFVLLLAPLYFIIQRFFIVDNLLLSTLTMMGFIVPFVMLYRLEGQQLYLFIKNKVRDKQ
jgi:O-antigen/teichoic acid export membrane protein